MLKFRVLVSVLAIMTLSAVSGFAADSKSPGELKYLPRSGDFNAAVGDLLYVSFESNGSLGPANPAADLKVETEGDAARKVAIVIRPPEKPMPGTASRIEAYWLCEKAGDTSIKVTPIDGSGKPGATTSYKVKVSETHE